MKKRYLIIACLIAINASAQDSISLEILHTNDTHSCIQPLSKNLADTAKANRGGYLRRMAMLDVERAANPQLLLFDSGDFSQGSTYYTLFKGAVEIGLMNLMHYDAATLGNHEFDFGMDNLEHLVKTANFPIVCANYDFKNSKLEGLVKPYTIIYRNGIKIGVFGLSPKLKGLAFDKNFTNVVFNDPIPVAEKTAYYLKNTEHCDFVICLSHLGWSLKDGYSDDYLMAKTRNIDLVLGGHSHTFFKQLQWVKNEDGKEIPNDQNGNQGLWIGKMIIKMIKK
jgi:5'-nucleotidase